MSLWLKPTASARLTRLTPSSAGREINTSRMLVEFGWYNVCYYQPNWRVCHSVQSKAYMQNNVFCVFLHYMCMRFLCIIFIIIGKKMWVFTQPSHLAHELLLSVITTYLSWTWRQEPVNAAFPPVISPFVIDIKNRRVSLYNLKRPNSCVAFADSRNLRAAIKSNKIKE